MSATIESIGVAETVRSALARTPTEGQAGVLAMALMPEDEFRQRLAALKKGQERIRQIKHDLMDEDSHYGVIPGTDKPTLLKPGAELLCSIYGLRADFLPRVEYGDGTTAPAVRVSMRCELHLGDLGGPVVAVGYGAANSWERKHRYRRGERICPECGVVGAVIKGKADFGGGWLCWQKKGGCGAKWPEGTAAIEDQAVSDIENPDQHDLENTLLKMSEKRAFIDAALRATASSDLFTQDLDEEAPPAPKPRTAAAPKPTTTQREPGEDEWPEEGPTAADLEAMGVEPNPDYDPEAAHERPAPASRTTRGVSRMEPCPKCKTARSVMVSKYAGPMYYCKSCKAKFGPIQEQP